VLAQHFWHRKAAPSSPCQSAQRFKFRATILNSIPTFPLLQSIFFSTNTSSLPRTNLPYENSGLRILSLLLSDDPPVEIPVSAINMIQTPHLFSHQQQHYGQNEQSSWASHSQQQSHQGLSHAQQHAQAQAQAQAAAAAAAAAQQQAYNRIAVNQSHHNPHSQNNNRDNRQSSGDSMNNAANSMTEQGSPGMGMGDISEENRKVLQWVAELMDPARREGALMELSKKREQVPELALVLWHSFGVMTSLLQEIISVYPLLNPSQLTATASNRVCNALALLQCVASHNETRGLFLSGISAMGVHRPLPC
jgi:hypothetical protein